jgi:hypothetical protein
MVQRRLDGGPCRLLVDRVHIGPDPDVDVQAPPQPQHPRQHAAAHVGEQADGVAVGGPGAKAAAASTLRR